MFEGYKGKIVHVIGGLHDFMGEIDTGPGNGNGWIRINNPCLVQSVQKKNEVGELISKMGGPQRVYEDHVDIYIPPGQSILEIRVLKEGGGLHHAYMKQINQPKIDRLVVPGMPGFFAPPATPRNQ